MSNENAKEPVGVVPGGGCEYIGLTKRELFAAMAMQGLASGLEWCSGRIVDDNELASDAVSMADALLRELAKQQP